MTRRSPAWALLGLLLLAGCQGPPADPADPAPGSPPGATAEGDESPRDVPVDGAWAADPRPWIHYHECDEYHILLLVPASGLEAFLPDGFQFAPQDPVGATAGLLLVVTSCSASLYGAGDNVTGVLSEPYASAWFLLLVLPPGEYANSSLSYDAVPVEVHVSSEEAAAAYAAWGVAGIQTSSITPLTHADAAGARADEIDIHVHPDRNYRIATTVSADPEAFAAGTGRVWVAADGALSGWIEVGWGEAPGVGSGSAVLTYDGDPLGGAPTAYPGLAHQVTGLMATARWAPLDRGDAPDA